MIICTSLVYFFSCQEYNSGVCSDIGLYNASTRVSFQRNISTNVSRVENELNGRNDRCVCVCVCVCVRVRERVCVCVCSKYICIYFGVCMNILTYVCAYIFNVFSLYVLDVFL